MAMASMTHRITGGVDTHLDVHVAAALDELGALLGTESFPADARGYRQLLRWLRSFGEVVLVGVEGTGSYGAGLTRLLHAEGVRVVEVDRPNRQNRRRRGKSDTVDAVAAARSAQSGDANGGAKTRDGNVEMMRVLRLVKLSARRGRTVALNQMQSIVATGPEELGARFRNLPAPTWPARCSSQRATTRSGSAPNGPSPSCAALPLSTPRAASRNGTGSAGPGTAKPTRRCGGSS
jgi:hypothetical protein